MIAYNADFDIRLVKYFETKHRVRVPLHHAGDISLALQAGQTEFHVRARCVVTDIPVNIRERAEDLRSALP